MGDFGFVEIVDMLKEVFLLVREFFAKPGAHDFFTLFLSEEFLCKEGISLNDDGFGFEIWNILFQFSFLLGSPLFEHSVFILLTLKY